MDDMIDFPVSDTWRDHYAAQGLTYPSGRHERRMELALEQVHADLELLGEILKRLEPFRQPPRSGPDESPRTPPPQPESGFDPTPR